MALVLDNNIEKVNKERNYIHQVTYCTYSVFSDENGNKYLQLDTYGSDNRKLKNKISQSIQLDRKSARKLLEILNHEFGF